MIFYFLLYIKSRHFEKTDNDTKVALFTGYLAALQLSYYNETTGEDVIYLYDRHLIEVYSNIKNVSNKGKNYNINSILYSDTNEKVLLKERSSLYESLIKSFEN